MCIFDSQQNITPLSIYAIQLQAENRVKRLDAYQAEMAALDAARAEHIADLRFRRLFRIRQAIYRWAPTLAARMF